MEANQAYKRENLIKGFPLFCHVLEEGRIGFGRLKKLQAR